MKKYLLSLGALALLASCSSEPSDFRPGQKVSSDAVYAGGRPTGLYPSNDESNASHRAAPAGHGEGHGEGHGAGHGEGHGEAHGEGHTQGEMHDADASGAAATGSEHQQSNVSDAPTETGATPDTKAAAEAAEKE